jgi:hypothetical protein
VAALAAVIVNLVLLNLDTVTPANCKVCAMFRVCLVGILVLITTIPSCLTHSHLLVFLLVGL